MSGLPLLQDVILSRCLPKGEWLNALREPWPAAVIRLLAQQSSVVRVLIAAHRGSVPRETGTLMLVTHDDIYGTIGGGHLEWRALQQAHELLVSKDRMAQVQPMVLGRELAQCCGGEVHLWLERFTQQDLHWLRQLSRAIEQKTEQQTMPLLLSRLDGDQLQRHWLQPGTTEYQAYSPLPTHVRLQQHENTFMLLEALPRPRASLWLYGAGHVGQALVRMLSPLSLDIVWVDSRADMLPTTLPDNVHPLIHAMPSEVARDAPAAAHHRVLTHDHSLDYAICQTVLLKNRFATLGVIGSRSKAARFRHQLRRDGIAEEQIAKLLAQLGTRIASKEPAAIAISIAAQWLQQLTPADEAKANVDTSCSEATCDRCRVTGAT